MNVLRFVLFQSHSTANLLPLAIFKKIQDFYRKTHLFFLKKKPNVEHFEKSYYLSCILRQVYFNLMKKIDIQTREQPLLARSRELNWQTSS